MYKMVLVCASSYCNSVLQTAAAAGRGFLELEADVSEDDEGGEASSDETDGGNDEFEASFVNDCTLLSQAVTQGIAAFTLKVGV